ncbi:MAG: alpha/beta hydrolase [Gracilibacteraceae bacterium]|jgi:pimeloyl-ACP methyl ester carboxylesterase|nr:alpha/beta hydrolase [Gracilibacteraceae bacterium]
MFIHANGLDIYYEKSGAGKPVLLLHGNGEDHTKLNGLASALSKEYSVYSLDTRCHGKSAKTETLHYHDMMEDVAGFIAELKLARPLLLGASDGGITGLLLTIQYPDLLSGLIACGANTHPSQLKKWFLTIVKIGFIATKDPKLLLMLKEPDIRKEELASIKTPVLLLAGRRDVLPTPASMEIASSIPDSEITILKGQTHSSYLKRYEITIDAIEPFLKRISK